MENILISPMLLIFLSKKKVILLLGKYFIWEEYEQLYRLFVNSLSGKPNQRGYYLERQNLPSDSELSKEEKKTIIQASETKDSRVVFTSSVTQVKTLLFIDRYNDLFPR